MKIAHLDSHRDWRGGQQQVLYLTRFLLSKGHESVIVAPPGGALFRRTRAAGLPVTGLNMRHELDLLAAWQLGTWLRREGVDILHMHEPHAHSIGLLAGMVAPRVRKVVSRRVDFRLGRNVFSRYKYTMHGVRYLAVSEAVRKVMLDCGIAADAVHTVYSGVDLRRIDAVQETSHEFPIGSRVIGTVGHLSGHKGHRHLLKAMRDVLQVERKARLVIVGEGKLHAELGAEAAALGLGDTVCFAGFRHDVLALIRGFEIFVFPSTQEALGTSILDAMGLRKPVVATRVGGIPESVQDNVTGLLVPPGDPRALAEALCTIMRKPDRGRLLGEAGRRRVEKCFTADRTGAATLGIYNDVLDQGSS